MVNRLLRLSTLAFTHQKKAPSFEGAFWLKGDKGLFLGGLVEDVSEIGEFFGGADVVVGCYFGFEARLVVVGCFD